MSGDARIKQEVIRELNWDPRVDHARIDVQVDDGIVALAGAVASYSQKRTALDAAHRVAGVRDIVNEIKVRVPGSMECTEMDIARAVRHALAWDVRVPESQIRSTVTEGWVTLEGDVGTWFERDAAEHAVIQLASVRGVINTINVNLPYVKTKAIRSEIEQTLEGRAMREARHVDIDVRDDVVTLTGAVQSTAEREAVLGAARYTQGVRDVEDRLHIETAEESRAEARR